MNKWVGGRIWDSAFQPSSFVVNQESLTINNPTAAMVSQTVTVKPNTNYTFKVDYVLNGQGYVYSSDGTQIVSGAIINADGLEFNSGAYTEIITSLYKNSGAGANSITYNNIQLEEGTSFTTFEKYNLNAKPSTLVPRKNLFDGQFKVGESYNTGDGGLLVNASYMRNLNRWIPVKPNTQYFLSESIGGLNKNVYYYDRNKNFISYFNFTSVPFTTPANCWYVNFRFQSTDPTIVTQLEEGMVSTEFEKYNLTNKAAILPNKSAK